ncbi:MAG TPA: hypothetical protein VNT56_10620, partial [Acidimicrobiales bacterium]|nr:hypothetical protein [Acidimicrobiales bacterium]
ASTGGGCCLGGGSDQSATVTNVGVANANTGNNVAVGNASNNTATNNQLALALGGGNCCGDAVASNIGGASNHSDGTATIHTGDASATGVAAHTTINQLESGGDCCPATPSPCQPCQPQPKPCGTHCDPQPRPCGTHCDPQPRPCGTHCDPQPEPDPCRTCCPRSWGQW